MDTISNGPYIGENEVVHFTTEGDQSSGLPELLSSNGEVKCEKITDVVGQSPFQVNNWMKSAAARGTFRHSEGGTCDGGQRAITTPLTTFKGNRGDLIQIFRDGPYQHWAVYIGKNEVVHLVNEGGDSSGSSELLSSNGKVKIEKFADVVGNDRHQVNNLLDDMYKARMPMTIVKEARDMMDSELQYNVDTYNSEHFATEMRYDKAESRQFKGKPGDLIEIFRDGPYQHWAVYIGENEVVHFFTDGGQSSGSLELLSSRGKVKREKLADEVGNHRRLVNNLLDNIYDALEHSVIVKKACEMVGSKLPYNVATYNCEHFATEMRYGKAESRQFKGKPGDLIEIFRGPYQHWDVYIGENEVVHFTTDGDQSSGSLESLSSRAEVKHEKLTDVVGNHRFKVNILLDKSRKAREPSVIVKEACAMVGRELSYNVATYNCEHFAVEMRYGKAESRQFKGKPGDLIEISRWGYQHWAVYIGENEVVHLVNEGDQSSGSSELLSSSNGKVKCEKITDVVGNHHFQVNNLLDEKYKARDPSIIVKEARAMVDSERSYNVATYNCEHFAIEMRYGKAESRKFNGKPGDLIEIFRWGYQHWAVYIGENEVVHLVNEGGRLLNAKAEVKREKLADVVAIPHFQVNNLLDEKYKARDPSIIVKEACEMVGSELTYGVVKYNSKHFAIEMRYGKAESRQFKGKPGDLIEIFRGPYQHWAVYIGGNEVVHFTTEGDQSSGSLESLSSRAEVKREKLTDVVGNHRFKVNILLDKSRKAREPSVIVKEACAMVGRELSYNVATYNCEHFAVEMRYGKAESRQFKGKPGDLIQIFRDGPYQHWAVYIRENEVVHFTTDGGDSSGSSELLSSNGKVKLEKITDVVGDHRHQVNNLLDEKYDARKPMTIVKEACEMMDSELQYNVDTYNSKHFAIEMRYGKAESRQVKGKPGDLIQIFRDGPYQHWAVYIGENEVVHFTTDGGQSSGSSANPSSSTGKVKREKLTKVVSNHHFKVNNLLDEKYEARKPMTIVEEACEMVGCELQYNVATYTCEHFATEMRYGKAESRQFKGKPGDLIKIFRDGPYQHWAVYIGGQEVVHFTTDGGDSSGSSELLSSNGKVKIEKFADVVGNDRHQVNNLLDDMYKARMPMTIVKEARDMMDSELQYNVDTYNSKHFATEMRYGKAESRQFNGKPGDLIEIFRGPYQHWAVYIGENEVVHFTTDGGHSSGSSELLSSNGKVKREKLTDVVGNHRHQVNNLLDEKYDARKPMTIVKEACVMVGSELPYNVATYNCEHFATEMRYGKVCI
ncbi:uncharacterized protein LOC118116247 [Hippoglossus stenolepis]|uniref:uncharacterized protein LOC118116247 n=1 Tax=Hippoglossus stenolepis TaxID=195615 RepID=UPI001FAE759C|nr:uncharacterized protein LOC118116247 [Hippoglossus stenolepis]